MIDITNYQALTELTPLSVQSGTAGNDIWIAPTALGASSLDGAAQSDLVSNDVLIGGLGNDIINGGAGADLILGGAGADSLIGGTGNDILLGGRGNDALQGGAGDDVYGFSRGNGSDVILDASGSDTLVLGRGIARSDIVARFEGADLVIALRDPAQPTLSFDAFADRVRLTGWRNAVTRVENIELADGTVLDAAHIVGLATSDDADVLSFTEGQAAEFAGGGDDVITTGSYDDTLDGGTGNDTLSAGAGSNIVRGGDGNDVIVAGAGKDSIDGGAGIDTATYAAESQAIVADLGAGTVQRPDGTADTLAAIENIIGTAFSDKLTGGTGSNALSAGAGNDTLFGSLGSDTLDGGAGSDTADYSTLATGVTIDYGAGTVGKGDGSTDRLVSIETIIASSNADLILGDGVARALSGGAGSDTIRGGAASETIDGGTGDDILSGGLGSNTDLGGDGADTILGGLGIDSIDGGAGVDTVEYAGLAAGVAVDLGAGTATKAGGAVDRLANIENVSGTAFADTLIGDGNANVLSGGAGADVLKGASGNDTYVFGRGSGKDTVLDDLTTQVAVTTAYTYYEDVWVSDWKYGGYYVSEARTGYTTTMVTQQQDGGDDTLQFGAGITLDSLFMTMSDSDLVVGLRQTDASGHDLPVSALSDVITLQNWQNPLNPIETFRFSDGSTIEMRAVTSFQSSAERSDLLTAAAGNNFLSGGRGTNSLIGGTGNDILVGGTGTDRLAGGAGNDTLVVGGGNETYVFGRGDGQDTIVNKHTVPGSVDQLEFGSAIASSDVWFAKASNDLLVALRNSSDTLTVKDWFANSDARLDSFKLADGKTLRSADVDALVNAMAGFVTNSSAGSSAVNVTQVPASVQVAINNAWHA